MFNNAIAQTQDKPIYVDASNFKQHLLNVIEGIDFSFVKKDVERFLEDKNELHLFEKQSFEGLVERYFQETVR